jgi:hypothetical protein
MTVCNPVNISYRFQLEGISDRACREAADPSVVFYEGEFWLYASKSGGYWRSPDLRAWTFVPSSALPVEDYAPDAEVIDGRIVVTASRRGKPCPVYRTTDPAADDWEAVCDCPEHNDPALFQDDNGRVYRYWGCSNHLPLYACELDRGTLLPIGETVEVYHAYAPGRVAPGWERRGENHGVTDRPPHVEGPWMTKYAGRYYLQYAAPGTQYNVYGDAVLVGDGPLGPFEMQASNPFSYKPGGFLPGAGHGSTFRDRHGNWWHASTMRISVRHKFERRIGLWPAGFDDDGVMFCNTAYGDWPMRMPQGRWDPWDDAFAGWMLLSYRARAEASASLAGHGPERAFDEDVQTYWAAAGGQATLTADLGDVCEVRAIQTNFAEHDADQHGRNGEGLFFRYRVEGSADGKAWETLIDKPDSLEDLPHDYVELPAPAEARWVRLSVLHVPSGAVAVSGLRVFGAAPVGPPGRVEGVRFTRCDADPRDARVEWAPQMDATGYVVRWGVASDKLYNSAMVYGAASLELRCLQDRVQYVVSVEAFNGGGVSPLALQGA